MVVARLEVTGRMAVLTLDNPPVNALSQGVRAELVAAVARLAADDAVDGMVIACAGRTFIAGADIREFGLAPQAPSLPEVVDAIEASAKPIIAALHGTILGGGLEVAMACHGRVSTPSAKLGLPEVTLGLMPGAGGTVRLPRLIGLEKSLEMITSGKPISADEALSIGLVDQLSPEDDLKAAATSMAVSLAANGNALRVRDRNDRLAGADLATIDQFAAGNARRFERLEAPAMILDALRDTITFPFDIALTNERRRFEILRDGRQSNALRHKFTAERQAGQVEGARAVARPVAHVGVIGAGTMGTGIAINFLLAGISVVLVEQQQAALDRGVVAIRKVIEGNVTAGRMAVGEGETALSLLTSALDSSALAQADLVIEAAFETMEVKRAIFGRLDEIAKPGAILASNTSYLDLDAIAAVTGRPEDVIGLHFFSPANIMKLLEVVRGSKTAPDVLATALAVAKRIRKIAVISGNAYGFIGNRMLAVRRQQAELMVHEGASPYDVDRVLETFGLAMGPFRIGDLAGLDLGWSAETSTGSTLRERLCEAGRRGQKTGAGFYDYDEQRRASPSQAALGIIAGFNRDQGFTQRSFADSEILDRLLWPMVNEGARILEEGIAQRASDIDVVWLNGYGWPAWTGGPMFHADTVGLAKVAAALDALGIEPCETIRRLAASNGTFVALDAENRKPAAV